MGRVIVIGGGIAGAGVARDLALRGIEVSLIERDIPAAGATGRCHGLLHSGARYVVKDPKAAAECASEGPVIKRTAPHCVEDTGGLLVAISEADTDYGDLLLPACRAAGVSADEMPVTESPNANALRCIRTLDAAVDPFLLTLSNLYDAYRSGADIMVGRGVKRIDNGTVVLEDGTTLKADAIVNATGFECGRLLLQSGLDAPAIQPDKGTILVTERRMLDLVVSRMRMPSDGDIIVPGHTTSLIGTTSSRSDSTIPARDEYRRLMKEAVTLLPSLKGVRIIRAFSGVRPLAGAGDGRDLSRDFKICEGNGVVTIAGGKLTTYRLIAEQASDAVMKLLGERGACHTKSAMLPDIRRDVPVTTECKCESAGQRIIELGFLKGVDVSKYNRLGFGTCQGMRCAKSARSPEAFLQERWKGVLPVLDESQLRQAYVSWAAHKTRAGK
ncbi:MAG: FAD-dependent oxidoreductase [Methanocella sp.]